MTNHRPNEGSEYYNNLTVLFDNFKVPVGTPVIQYWRGGEPKVYYMLTGKPLPLTNIEVWLGTRYCSVFHFNSGIENSNFASIYGIGTGKWIYIVLRSRDHFEIEEGMVIEQDRLVLLDKVF